MSDTTPPGWYPDQRQTGSARPIERWWDGTSWTEYTRTAEQPQAGAPGGGSGSPPGAFGPDLAGPPAAPGMPPYQPPPNRRNLAIGVGIVAVLAVAGVIIAVVVTNGGDDGGKQAKPSHSASTLPKVPGGGDQGLSGGQDGGGSGGQDGGGLDGGQDNPDDPPNAAVDHNLGVSLPVPSGWQKQDTQQAGNAYISTQPYSCDSSSTHTCVAGGAYTEPSTANDPESAATKDISANAKDSYGDIKSHHELKKGKVTVAGQSGYYVRWSVDPTQGTNGTVESVAFKSPANGAMTVIRFGIDDSSKAPKLSIIDTILKGTKAVGPTNGA